MMGIFTPRRRALIVDLDRFKVLMAEFIRERGEDENQLTRQLLMSDFLLWLQERRTKGDQELLISEK